MLLCILLTPMPLQAIHKRGSTFKPSILDKNTERNTNSTQFINKKENGAIPDTVTGSRLLTKSQPGPQVRFLGIL